MSTTRRVIGVSALAFYFCTSSALPLSGVSFFSPRSPVTNAAQELIRDQQFIYQNAVIGEHLFDLSVGYAQSLASGRLAMIIFGDDTFTVSGSQVTDRADSNLLADYFGLSPTFVSNVKLAPCVQNIIIPATLYYAFDFFVPGLYARIQIPFVWTQTDVEMFEEVLNDGTSTAFPAYYMRGSPLVAPFNSFTQALQQSVPFGAVKEVRNFGNIHCGKTHKSALSNTTWDLGFNYFFDEEHNNHIGFKLRLVTPNSDRPHCTIVYEPIAGNGHHWEGGAGINGHFLLWQPDAQQELNLYLNLLITHIFASRQQRSFDLQGSLCNSRFLSRYMLVKEFDTTGAPTGLLSPLINHSTLFCNISTAAEFDGALMFAYTRNNFTFDFGYNGWIRTKEHISLKENLPLNKFGLKGIQNTTTSTLTPSPISQSNATIYGNDFTDQVAVADIISPQFIHTSDIDTTSARSPLVVTHKIFTHLCYTWGKLHKGQTTLQPFFGFSAECEFEGINDTNEDEPPTDKNTMAQWSIWLRGGIAFG